MALRDKGPLDEEDDWQVLLKKAEKFEIKESQKITANMEKLLTLGQLLDDAYLVRRPHPGEYQHRRELVRVFNEITKELYGRGVDCPVVKEFGSFLMDLFTTGSDLDLSINFRNGPFITREQKIKTLRKFARKFYALQSGGHVCGVLPVMTAKVPILKVVDVGTGIECDLSVENRDGILKSAIIHLISSIDERFHKLSFLMKAWAKAHDINSSKDRTLNSLSIILLVAFHLQTRDPPILPPFSAILKDGQDLAAVQKSIKSFEDYGKRNTESLGALFVSFFVKLASVEKLWPKGLCASPYQGRWISKTWDTKIACMSVEDFTELTENVARAVGKSEVEEIHNCVHLTIQNLDSFMNGQIDEAKLKESLFGNGDHDQKIRQPRPPFNPKQKQAQPATLKKTKESLERKQKVVSSNPLLSMKKVLTPNGWEAVATRNWETVRPPTVGYWSGKQREGMIPDLPVTNMTAPDSLQVLQPVMNVDHHSTTKKRNAEVLQGIDTDSRGWPSGQGWRGPGVGNWGGLGWRQGWGGEPTGSWGWNQGADSIGSVSHSQGMQPTDRWGIKHQRPPTDTSFFSYGSTSHPDEFQPHR